MIVFFLKSENEIDLRPQVSPLNEPFDSRGQITLHPLQFNPHSDSNASVTDVAQGIL